MNFLQLVNRTRQNCGVSGADYVTTAGASGECLRLCNWVAEAYLDIQAMREDWEWLRKSVSFPTVAMQSTYTIAQIGVTDYGLWARDTWRNYSNPIVSFSVASPAVMGLNLHGLNVGDTITPQTTGVLPTGIVAGQTYYVQSTPTPNTVTLSATLGGPAIATTGTQNGSHTITSNNTTTFAGFLSEVFVEYIEYDTWRDAYQFGALRQQETRPFVITITPNKSLALGPFPDNGYTMVGDYYSVPVTLANDTDIPALPAKFHLAIVYSAMIAYGNYENAEDVLGRGQTEYNKWIRRVLADQIPEIGTGGALA